MLYPPDRMTDGACSARCCQPNCSDCSSRNGRESRFETKYKKQKRKKPKYVKININAHVTTKKADKNLVQIIMKNCALTRKLFAKKIQQETGKTCCEYKSLAQKEMAKYTTLCARIAIYWYWPGHW